MEPRQQFSELSTNRIVEKMRPCAIEIYKQLWPSCVYTPLETFNGCPHVLDTRMGIDAWLRWPDGNMLTLQEKYRDYDSLRWGDFTQEYKNAAGTPFESDGEWFHLAAQLYFYGWANEFQTAFAKWILFDVARYKLKIQEMGGLGSVGVLRRNSEHGAATFYGIPLRVFSDAVIAQG